MTGHLRSIRRGAPLAAALLCILLLATSAFADPTTEARRLLQFCKDHPEVCSLSIHYKGAGQQWDLDYHGTRLNSISSTIKVIELLAYANAAIENRIDPEMLISRDLWARFWIGNDGGALAAAYNFFNRPVFITHDQ